MMKFLYRKATRAIDSLSLGYPSAACALLVSLETVACLRAASFGQERLTLFALWAGAVLLGFQQP